MNGLHGDTLTCDEGKFYNGSLIVFCCRHAGSSDYCH